MTARKRHGILTADGQFQFYSNNGNLESITEKPYDKRIAALHGLFSPRHIVDINPDFLQRYWAERPGHSLGELDLSLWLDHEENPWPIHQCLSAPYMFKLVSHRPNTRPIHFISFKHGQDGQVYTRQNQGMARQKQEQALLWTHYMMYDILWSFTKQYGFSEMEIGVWSNPKPKWYVVDKPELRQRMHNIYNLLPAFMGFTLNENRTASVKKT